jgi:IclR family acetate operon transcriptional repressor
MGRPKSKPEENGKSSSAIGKAFAVIRMLRVSPSPFTLAHVAAEVGIAASTAHSLLSELLAQGIVAQDADKRYQLGPGLFYLGSAYARHTPLFRSVWVELVNLANEFDVTAALATPWDNHHLIIASHRAGEPPIEIAFGGRVPLDSGSWGKAFYAGSGVPMPSKLTSYTGHTIKDLERYRQEVESVRERGFATDDEEFSEGVAAVAAPISSYSGYEGLVSVLTSAAKMKELTVDRVGARLAALAGRAVFALGGESRMMLGGSIPALATSRID